ncbi:MAG: 16S rRNA (cytidine(1402)-2'-O)-methyltransferase [Candidatus Zixiibacteriota bacterium]|nr:MAG: 16S rRNA (cytidine(1402)-2'-O)-methyltransferase [candidate division Zixibacteria bacterium]
MSSPAAAGRLFLVPTPIGNLEDVTLRALRVLKEADLVLCEDTRRAAILFARYDIHTPRESFFDHNQAQRTPMVLERLRQGQKVALISEAGTPGISDPGFYLARAAIEAGLPVEALPGACAAVVALVGSGLPSDRFAFEGFLPAKKGRRTRLEQLKDDTRTLVFYEGPHRMIRTVTDLLAHLGDRRAAWGRELTKVHEEYQRGRLSDLLKTLQERPPRGEFTLVVEGLPKRRGARHEDLSEDD